MCRANNKIYYAMFGVKILSVILLCLNSFDSDNLMADSEYDVPYFGKKG